MDVQKKINDAAELIRTGKTEEALSLLSALLDSNPQYAELAQIVGTNQANFHILKDQQLKGIVAQEDARLALNQVNNNLLEVIKHLKNNPSGYKTGASKSQAWRYYVAGGIVALALAALGWRFFGQTDAPDKCPTFSTPFKVLVLPFLQTGDEQSEVTEIDITEELNGYLSKTPQLRNKATVAVRKGFAMSKETYPDRFEKAAELARDCGVNMIVWGRLNRSSDGQYRLAVRYAILASEEPLANGDTTLLNPLKTDTTGRYERDLRTVTQYLYLAIANHLMAPIAMNLLRTPTAAPQVEDMAPAGSAELLKGDDPSGIDTSFTLALATNQAHSGQTEAAIELYSDILDAYPTNSTARERRGSLLYEQGAYGAAYEDLEMASPSAKEADTTLLRYRVESATRSGQPVKAQQDLAVYRQKTRGGAWATLKEQQIRDSITALQKMKVEQEKIAQKSKNKQTLVETARVNLRLGNYDRAKNFAQKALQQDPRYVPALETEVEAALGKKDTAAARKTLDKVEQMGVSAKTVDRFRPKVQQLKVE